MSSRLQRASSGTSLDSQQTSFYDVFSLRPPKDARSGLASGLQSLGRGVWGGLVGLVAAPIVGASQEGVLGFGKGLATGGPGGVGTCRLVWWAMRWARSSSGAHNLSAT